MTQQRIGMGLVGPGFIARHHIDAVRRLGDVDVVGLAGSSLASAQRKAAEFKVPNAFVSIEALVNDPRIHVVHNTTPSYLHVPVTLAALKAGKHVISDKPLATTPADCALLCTAAEAAGVVNAVTFNYRGNPLVQEARVRIARDDIGSLVNIQGQYLQDWMTDENVYSWRMDPVKGGVSSALADIGSHWCDLAEHITGARISSVLADIHTVGRYALLVRRFVGSIRQIECWQPHAGSHPWRRSRHHPAALRQRSTRLAACRPGTARSQKRSADRSQWAPWFVTLGAGTPE